MLVEHAKTRHPVLGTAMPGGWCRYLGSLRGFRTLWCGDRGDDPLLPAAPGPRPPASSSLWHERPYAAAQLEQEPDAGGDGAGWLWDHCCCWEH